MIFQFYSLCYILNQHKYYYVPALLMAIKGVETLYIYNSYILSIIFKFVILDQN